MKSVKLADLTNGDLVDAKPFLADGSRGVAVIVYADVHDGWGDPKVTMKLRFLEIDGRAVGKWGGAFCSGWLEGTRWDPEMLVTLVGKLPSEVAVS